MFSTPPTPTPPPTPPTLPTLPPPPLSPPPATIPAWLFGFTVFTTTWLHYWLKYRPDQRKAYIERHSGDDENEAVKDNVKRIKRLMDHEFELQEQGLLMWLWYWPHERGLHVALVIFAYWFVLFLLKDVILTFLLWLFVDLPLGKKAIKWCKSLFRRRGNTDNIEMITPPQADWDFPFHDWIGIAR
jgi:hypothetical protein